MTRALPTRSLRHSGAIPETALCLEDASLGSSDASNHPGALPFLETSAPHKIILATDHPWSPPSVTPQQQIIPDLCRQFRTLIFLHVHNVKHLPAWAVMNIGGFLCMQSQQSTANNYDRYNKSTSADHLVTSIALVPSAHMYADQIKYKRTFSSREKGTPFSLTIKSPPLRLWQRISVNPVTSGL